jgi:vitamin B12 transporter
VTYLPRRAARAVCAAIALFPVQVLGQDAPKEEESGSGEIILSHPIASKNIVVTANGSPSRIWQVGQSITVLERATLERLQSQSVADLLSTTPGITVSRNGGPGKATALRIRGAEDSQTLTLIDGVRVNDPSSPGGAFDFGNLITGNIDRIEVLRGPNSVPWGSQAIGGVVNIVTARPTQSFAVRASAEYGFRDNTQFVGNVSGTLGPVAASFGGGHFKDDGISAYKDGTERDGYRQYGANGKITVDVASGLDLDFRGYYANSKTQFDGFPPPLFAFADTSDFSTAKELFGYAGANFRLFDEAFKGRLAFTISDINRDNFDAPGQALPSFLARGRVERFEAQGDVQLSYGLRTVFGLEHETSRFSDGFSPATTNSRSGYAQVIVEAFDTLTLSGGARIDDHKDYGSNATFSANAVWSPTGSTRVRASYGEGFKAPTLFQLNSFFGNTTLQPETAKSYDLGVEQSLINDSLTFGVTAFLRNTGDQIDFISCFGQTTGICTNRPFGTYNNIKRSRAKGVEAFIRLSPTDRLTLEANYSLTDAKDRSTGLTLLRRPKHSVNASIDWNARDWLRLGASVKILSDSFDSDFQTFSRTSLDGYSLVSVRMAIPIGETIEFYGRIENLFDQSYEVVSGYGTLGRNAHIGVRAKF